MKHQSAKITVVHDYFYHSFETPVGFLTVYVTKTGSLAHVLFGRDLPVDAAWKVEKNRYACGAAVLQLEEYFSGRRTDFNLELAYGGTNFQREIWYRLLKLQFGETISYSELARKAGRKDAYRAAASAVAQNPLPIVIPCHRVVPKSGGIGKYATRILPEAVGGQIKRFLLEHEQRRLA